MYMKYEECVIRLKVSKGLFKYLSKISQDTGLTVPELSLLAITCFIETWLEMPRRD